MKFYSNLLTATALLMGTALLSCGSSNRNDNRTKEESTEEISNIQVPEFNADSAYAYVAAQTAFGPRVPNSNAHKACGEYLAKQLEKFGAKVYNQYADLMAYDGTLLKARNIIGAYNPDTRKRVLLCAHWDSRPYADEDDPQHHHTPIDGANDGASGVGVLLEIARQLQQQAPAISQNATT